MTEQFTESALDIGIATHRKFTRSRPEAACPKCGTISKRHSEGHRILRDIGSLDERRPAIMEVTYSKHYCPHCCKHFSTAMDDIAFPSSRFTKRVREMAIKLVLARGFTLERATHEMEERFFVRVPTTTLHDWLVAFTPSADGDDFASTADIPTEN